MNTNQLQSRFVELYGRPASIAVRSPGRVNLIGEHTDYNQGFVLPIAIEPQTVGLAGPRADRLVRLASLQAQGDCRVSLDEPILRGEPGWANYGKGVIAGLIARGCAMSGADLLFDSDIPLGGGLSSSAALEVATAKLMLACAKSVAANIAATAPGSLASTAAKNAAVAPMQEIPPHELAHLCQQAEHKFALAPCGIMDQSIVIMGQAGHALLLDCQSLQTSQIPFGRTDIVLLVADTQVKHDISDGGYGARRQQCFDAAAKLGVKWLRDAAGSSASATGTLPHTGGLQTTRQWRPSQNVTLSGKELMRARHVIGEINRTLEAVAALRKHDYAAFGRLMYLSHDSLRDDFEVSCEELDEIVESAKAQRGVFGARMTGGGFGGCAIILAKADQARDIIAAVGNSFAKRFGRVCPILATKAAQGAEYISIEDH
jgi:galactokinase